MRCGNGSDAHGTAVMSHIAALPKRQGLKLSRPVVLQLLTMQRWLEQQAGSTPTLEDTIRIAISYWSMYKEQK
jgi:hypothetical protein